MALLGEEADWEWKGDESLHPFWAVRRLTATQLAAEPTSSRASGFNVTLATEEISHVTCGRFKSKSWSITHVVSIPILTNLERIKKGTELVLQVEAAEKKSTSKKRTWKDALAQDERKDAQEQTQVAKLREKKTDGASRNAAGIITV